MKISTINSLAEFKTSLGIVSSVLAGSLYGFYQSGKFELTLFCAVMIASFMSDSAATIFNQYFDFHKAISKDTYNFESHNPISAGLISSKSSFAIGLITLLIAAVLGIYIVVKTSIVLLVIGGISMIVVYLYSGGKRPISYTSLGEIISGFFEGVIVFCVSFFVQSGYVSVSAFVISLIFCITIGQIMFANNISDIEEDFINGRNTLAHLLGKDKALSVLIFSYVIIVSILIFCVIMTWISITSVLYLLVIPLIIINYRKYCNDNSKANGFKHILFNSLIINYTFSFVILLGIIFKI